MRYQRKFICGLRKEDSGLALVSVALVVLVRGCVMGQENAMSDTRSGGASFSKVVQKHAGRAKEKVSRMKY